MRNVIIILLMNFALTGCGAKLPEIARDLPANYAEGERVFEARLQQRFPIGTTESELVSELTREGFEMKPFRDGTYAQFSDGAFPVSNNWRVIWKEDGGKLTEISALYYGVGP